MQPLAQGEENEGAGLMGSMDRCQVWKSSSKTSISTHQQHKKTKKKKEKMKLKLHQCGFFFVTSRAKKDPIFYVTLNVMMVLSSYIKRHLIGCICQFCLKLDGKRIHRISAAAQPTQTAQLMKELAKVSHHYLTGTSSSQLHLHCPRMITP